MEVLRKALAAQLLEDAENSLTVDFRMLLEGLQQDLVALDERVDDLDKKIKIIGKQMTTRPLNVYSKSPVGVIKGVVFSGAIGDGKQLKRGRGHGRSVGTHATNSTAAEAKTGCWGSANVVMFTCARC